MTEMTQLHTTIDNFLLGLKLNEYVTNFEQKGIHGINDLVEVDDAFLQDVGVSKIGHRKRILRELDRIRGNGDKELASYSSEENLIEIGVEPVVSPNVKAPETVDDDAPPPLPPKTSRKVQSLKTMKPPRPTPPARAGSARTVSPEKGENVPRSTISPPLPPRVDLGERDSTIPLPKDQRLNGASDIIIPDNFGETNLVNISSPEVTGSTPSQKPEEQDGSGLLIVIDNDDRESSPTAAKNASFLSFPQNASKAPDFGPSDSTRDENYPAVNQETIKLEEDKHSKSFSGFSAPPVAPPRPSSSSLGVSKPPRPPRPTSLLRKSGEATPEPLSAKESPLVIETPPEAQVQPGSPAVPPIILNSPMEKEDGGKGLDEESDSDQSVDNLDENGTLTLSEFLGEDVMPAVKVISMRRDRNLFDDAVASDRDTRSIRLTRMSCLNQRSGFLDKRGGEKGNKPFKKRWVVFDGNDLRYYKPSDKDTKSESLQIVPVSRMQDVEIVKGAKRPQFNLKTPNRTFVFSHEDHTEIILWSQILMQAILYRRQSTDVDVLFGGSFSEPDMEGFLKKQGHNVVGDWKNRYVAVKDSKVAYYYSFEDYKQDMPINTIDMALATVKLEYAKHRLQIVTPTREFWFETDGNTQLEQWKLAFETAIQVGLGDTEVVNKIRENHSNSFCADCGKKNPVWASTNLGVVVCAQCIGFHRHLGARISKARSILMDVKVWTKELIKFFQLFGNENANKLWEDKLPSDDKINGDATKDQRCEFIIAKYKEKRYFGWSRLYGSPDELGQALRENVVTDNVQETVRLLISGVDIYYTDPDAEDQRTPYELATDAEQDVQMELLKQFQGHLSQEEREQVCPSPEPERSNSTADLTEPVGVTWEKEGYLYKRGPKNTEAWKRTKFYLKERSFCYDRDSKEDGMIDLRKMVSVQLGQNEGDPTTINVSLSTNRVYYLKGDTVEEAEDWYTAIKNKQVIGVPIDVQDVNSNNVPYLVMKCVDFVESFGLEHEGIYRLSGSHATIKRIALLFNQDPRSVHLTLEEYPVVHDISGVLKLYLRELPEPIIESSLYDEFIENCSESNHYTKLWKFKDLIGRLPEVNRSTLRFLMLHLDKVVRNADKNKMNTDNVVTIFGPILMARGKTLDQAYLNKEFAVMNDILTYNQWLFDVEQKELQKDQQIENAKVKMEVAKGLIEKVTTGIKIDHLQHTVYVNSLNDFCMVKVTGRSNAADVCLYVINFKTLNFDANWALFEMINGCELERPLYSKELVLPLIMEGGKGYTLMLKPNYVAEMTAPYQNSDLGMKGNLHVKKNESGWKKNQYLEIRTGSLFVYAKKGGNELEKLSIHEMTLYIGIEKKKKPPGKYGITIRSGSELRYFCTDDENSMNQWVAVILAIRYPSGIWTNINAPETSPQTQGAQRVTSSPSNYWGRQSTYLRPSGASSQIMKELQWRKSKLKTIK